MKNLIAISLAIATLPAYAQTAEPALHTEADMAQLEAKLTTTASASPSGLAINAMDEFGSARTLLVVRVHTGEAERHQAWADQIVMKKGSVTLVSGGTMQGEHPNGATAGETLGAGIEGGKEITLNPGDTVHIPPGIPHWIKVPAGTTAVYLAFKEK